MFKLLTVFSFYFVRGNLKIIFLTVILFFLLCWNYMAFGERESVDIKEQQKIDTVIKTFVNSPELQLMLMEKMFFQELELKIDKYLVNENSIKEKYNHNISIEFIPYQTVQEFLAINPNCCVIKPAPNQKSCSVISSQYPANINNSCVYIKYLIRYKDEDGNIQSRAIFDGGFSGFDRTVAMISDSGEVSEWSTYLDIG